MNFVVPPAHPPAGQFFSRLPAASGPATTYLPAGPGLANPPPGPGLTHPPGPGGNPEPGPLPEPPRRRYVPRAQQVSRCFLPSTCKFFAPNALLPFSPAVLTCSLCWFRPTTNVGCGRPSATKAARLVAVAGIPVLYTSTKNLLRRYGTSDSSIGGALD
jgi:hypothetical protein